jgi:hypothetical protein
VTLFIRRKIIKLRHVTETDVVRGVGVMGVRREVSEGVEDSHK